MIALPKTPRSLPGSDVDHIAGRALTGSPRGTARTGEVVASNAPEAICGSRSGGLLFQASGYGVKETQVEWKLRSTKAWRLAMTVLLARVMLAPLFAVPAADARVNDCGAYDGWHYGAIYQDQNNVSGALADVDVTSAPVCRTHAGGAAAYSMLADASGEGYAQIGWGRFYGIGGLPPGDCDDGCTAFFWQTLKNPSSTPVDDYFQVSGTPGGPTIGQTFGFKVDWHNGNGQDQHIHLVITHCADSTASCGDWHETNFDPSAQWNGARNAQYSGETQDAETDMPGVSTDKTNFDNVQVRNGVGDYGKANPLVKCNTNPTTICGTAPTTGGGTYGNYNFAWVNDNTDGHFRIWTG
jgi:hypothetical protein